MELTSIAAANETTVDIIQCIKLALSKMPRRQQSQTEQAGWGPTVEELLGVTIHSHEILYKANTVFPFNFFPSTIIIDKEKLTIIAHYFFWVAKITSVPIRDILSVEANVGPFFGAINMTSRYFYTNPHSISYLWRKDALKIQQLLQGFIIANERDIDCSLINKSQLEILLEHLGETNEKVNQSPALRIGMERHN